MENVIWISLTHSSSLAGPCFGARQYSNIRVWGQSAWADFWCVCQVWPSLEFPGSQRVNHIQDFSWAGSSLLSWTGALLCTSVRCRLPPKHPSPTQEQRKVPLIWNSRISFYSTPQSILFSLRQGERCCFIANALYRKYRYLKPLLWPCLTFTLQINGSW